MRFDGPPPPETVTEDSRENSSDTSAGFSVSMSSCVRTVPPVASALSLPSLMTVIVSRTVSPELSASCACSAAAVARRETPARESFLVNFILVNFMGSFQWVLDGETGGFALRLRVRVREGRASALQGRLRVMALHPVLP